MVDPAVTRFLAALEETQYLAPDRMVAYQRRLLDRLLRHARAETDFYADRLAPVFRADDSIDWDRWTDIPILTREEAQVHSEALFARTVPAAAGETVTAFTSGSTGRPLRHGMSAMQTVAGACANRRFMAWHKLDPLALSALIVQFGPGIALYPAGTFSETSRLTGEHKPTAKLNIDTPAFQQVEWLRRTPPGRRDQLPVQSA